MKKFSFLLMLLCPLLQGEDKFFYDADNSCSLGCACDWDVIQPQKALQLGADTPDKPGDDAVIFSKCILVNPGSEISFKIKSLVGETEFRGFGIDAGSFDGKQDCTIPKEYVVLVNGKEVHQGKLNDVRSIQMINSPSVNIKNGDILTLRILSGYRKNKMIGITYLAPSGAH